MHRSFAVASLLPFCIQQLASAQFTGVIANSGMETEGLILVTIENNSTGNYSIEARNNLFDNLNPYRPLSVKTLAGQPVQLVGSSYPYGALTDAAFINFSPGSIWQRELNMTEYIPPDPTATKAYSACFSIAFISGISAVNTTDFQPDEDLATGFLSPNDNAEIFIEATPLHINITVAPGKGASAAAVAASTTAVGTQLPATIIQGTETGVGGAAPTVGSSIDDYIGGAAGIFAKHH